MSFSNILTFVDSRSETHREIERAEWLASVFDADIELFDCEYDQFLESERARSNVVADRRKALAEMAERLSLTDNRTPTVDVSWNSAADEAILEKVSETHPDIVIKDTHYHSLLRRTILTNDDWNLILHCASPLMLAKDRQLPSRPTVIAAVDPIHAHDKPATLDRRILHFAKTLCERSDAELRTVHVFDTAAHTAAAATPMGQVAASFSVRSSMLATDALRTEAMNAFDALLAEEGIDSARAEFREGNVAAGLIDCADELNADIVVMGAVSRGRMESALVGHTAQQVLDRIGCDLIVVK
jgi:universal stress protein E